MDTTNTRLCVGRVHAVRVLGVSVTLAILALAANTYRRYGTPAPYEIPLCENNPSDLGPISANKTPIDLEQLDENAFPEVRWGGHFAPLDCVAQYKVAIIVPYRNHENQLPIFLNHMHQFLMKQQLEYGIFIIEQASNDYFNRGKLFNAGFLESRKAGGGYGWECFIFHDIELLPLDLRNLYSCPHPQHPRHHAAAIDRQNFQLPRKTSFSGVIAMTEEQFTFVDGFSNTYWGFQGEDDDMVFRIHSLDYTISRHNLTVSRYASLDHSPDPRNRNTQSKWYRTMLKARSALHNDGLSTLKYQVRSGIPHRLYTHITVDIGRSPTYPQVLKLLQKYNFHQLDINTAPESVNRLEEEFIALL